VRGRSLALLLLIFASVAVLFREELAIAQAPPVTVRVQANLAQVMRGILLPDSNVIFFAQSNNPAGVKPAPDPSSATDPLASSYGGWTAVENSSLALSEAARLLTVAGRRCSNGRPVPVMNADWMKFVQGLRDAGIIAFKAAQTKDQDKMLDAADAVTTACANCHNVYREKTQEQGGLASRCTK
jgi:hypothetical protein